MTDSRLPFVSIVVPVRNGEETIGPCLEALVALDYRGAHDILVVDNGSSDSTAARVADLGLPLVQERAQGRAIARNTGIRETRGEIVAFVDADCIAEPSWLTELVRPYHDPDVAGVGGEIHAVPPETAVQVYLDRRESCWQQYCVQGGRRKRSGFLITANASYRRSVLELVGGFDPHFVTAEDVDLGYRVRNAGYRLAYAGDAIVRHQLRATTRELFRQRYGYGYGRVLLRRRHDLRRGYSLPRRREMAKHALSASLLTVRSLRTQDVASDAAYARCEAVESVALRFGATHAEVARVVPRIRLLA